MIRAKPVSVNNRLAFLRVGIVGVGHALKQDSAKLALNAAPAIVGSMLIRRIVVRHFRLRA
jgi:hypothetical protein